MWTTIRPLTSSRAGRAPIARGGGLPCFSLTSSSDSDAYYASLSLTTLLFPVQYRDKEA